MKRSIPIEKAINDALLAYGQNGERFGPRRDIRSGSSFRDGKATRT